MTPRPRPAEPRPRRVTPRPLCVLIAVCALALLPAGTANAHPLGNFTVNRYDGLVAAPGRLRVDHGEDLAGIPATQAEADIERLGLSAWTRRRCARAAADSALRVDGRTTALTAAPRQRAHVPAGPASTPCAWSAGRPPRCPARAPSPSASGARAPPAGPAGGRSRRGATA
ncbi:hypothetical protein SCANM63S_10123 [Streptomyces canarius]